MATLELCGDCEEKVITGMFMPYAVGVVNAQHVHNIRYCLSCERFYTPEQWSSGGIEREIPEEGDEETTPTPTLDRPDSYSTKRKKEVNHAESKPKL